MKLTATNSQYDAKSGAFIVTQSDELKMLMEISSRLGRVEKLLDRLVQGSGLTDGREVAEQ